MKAFKGDINEVPTSKRLALAKGMWDWEPHPSQREWLLDTSRVKCAACGRRWGKTESAIIDDLTLAIAVPGITIMNIAPTNDQVRLLYNPAKALVDKTPELEGCKCIASPHPQIMIGDSTILYYSSGEDGKNIRGHTAHRIRIDEAAYVKDVIVNSVLMPMLMDYNGQLILQGTPYGKNWFYTTFEDGREGPRRRKDHASFTFPSTSNPHTYAKTFVEEMKAKYGESSMFFRAEYLAEFVDGLGTVFPWEDICKCLYESSTQPAHLHSYIAGIDPALYSDYCSVIVGSNDNGMCYIVDWEYFNRVGWTDTKKRIYEKVSQYDAVGVIDSTHGNTGDAIYYELSSGLYVDDSMGRNKQLPGLKLIPVSFTNKNKEDMVKKLQVRLAQGLLRIPKHFTELIDELKYFGYELSASGKTKYEAQGDYHDDLVMALALMISQVYGNYAARNPDVLNNPMCYANFLQRIEEAELLRNQMVIGNERIR